MVFRTVELKDSQILTLDGEPARNERVLLSLDRGSFVSEGIVLAGQVVRYTNAQGVLNMNLWVNSDGDIPTVITCRVRNEKFSFVIDGGTPRQVSMQALRSTGMPIQRAQDLTIQSYINNAVQSLALSQGKYRHYQAVAATEWVVNHNLGFFPCVRVTTLGGETVLADVRDLPDAMTLIVSHEFLLAGYVNCS